MGRGGAPVESFPAWPSLGAAEGAAPPHLLSLYLYPCLKALTPGLPHVLLASTAAPVQTRSPHDPFPLRAGTERGRIMVRGCTQGGVGSPTASRPCCPLSKAGDHASRTAAASGLVQVVGGAIRGLRG